MSTSLSPDATSLRCTAPATRAGSTSVTTISCIRRPSSTTTSRSPGRTRSERARWAAASPSMRTTPPRTAPASTKKRGTRRMIADCLVVRAHCSAVAEQHMSASAADGAALAVSAEGDGEPLLLIPGLGATRRVFDPLTPALRSRHRVIRFDPRGVGDSERGTLALSMAVLAADAIAVADSASASEAVDVFGASMGGVVAQQLVVDHPERVRRLILAATQPPGAHAIPADPTSRAALLGRGAHTPEEAYRIACTVLYSPQFQRAHPEFIDEQVRVRAQHPIPARVFRDQLAAMAAASG